jgi:hypothetical protein
LAPALGAGPERHPLRLVLCRGRPSSQRERQPLRFPTLVLLLLITLADLYENPGKGDGPGYLKAGGEQVDVRQDWEAFVSSR